MTKSRREPPGIKKGVGDKVSSFSEPGLFWQLQMSPASSFHSPQLFIPLIGASLWSSPLFFFFFFLASPYSANDPRGLAGDERRQVKDLREREGGGRRSKAPRCMSAQVRALDARVSFGGQLGNERIPLTPVLRRTGKVTLIKDELVKRKKEMIYLYISSLLSLFLTSTPGRGFLIGAWHLSHSDTLTVLNIPKTKRIRDTLPSWLAGSAAFQRFSYCTWWTHLSDGNDGKVTSGGLRGASVSELMNSRSCPKKWNKARIKIWLKAN